MKFCEIVNHFPEIDFGWDKLKPNQIFYHTTSHSIRFLYWEMLIHPKNTEERFKKFEAAKKYTCEIYNPKKDPLTGKELTPEN